MGPNTFIDNSSNVRRVLIITLLLNSAVSAVKIIYGYLTNSISIISDGFHSVFDGVSNIIGLIGIWIAAHPPDENHPYGHKKFETLFTIAISFMIFFTSFQILKKVYFSFTEPSEKIVTPTSFIIMFITIAVNIFVSRYELKKGKGLKSDFLIADAMHTKSDVLASLAVIAGLFFVRSGYPVADSIVGLLITILIGKIGYEILKKAADALVDTVCINTSLIESIAKKTEGVKGCNDIRTRGSENHIYLDMCITVAPEMTTEAAHSIADKLEHIIKSEFPSVVDVVVHIEPEKNNCTGL